MRGIYLVTQQTIQGLTSYILFSIRLARHLSGACCQLWSELTQKQPFQRRGNISCHKRLSTGVSQEEKVDGKSAALHNSDFLSQEGLSRHLVRSPIYHHPSPERSSCGSLELPWWKGARDGLEVQEPLAPLPCSSLPGKTNHGSPRTTACFSLGLQYLLLEEKKNNADEFLSIRVLIKWHQDLVFLFFFPRMYITPAPRNLTYKQCEGGYMISLICSKITCQNVLCRTAFEVNQYVPLTYRPRACCLFLIKILSGICIFRLC